jgi:hypothetical protein
LLQQLDEKLLVQQNSLLATTVTNFHQILQQNFRKSTFYLFFANYYNNFFNF